MNHSHHWEQLARLLPEPENHARLKSCPADFRVREELGFAPSGGGEHLLVEVEKTGLTTSEAARRLVAACGVGQADIGYAGMKDRHARATQWFSLRLPESEVSRLRRAEDDSLRILQSGRNHRKIRIGSHRCNHFEILLRDFRGSREDLESRLATLATRGAPNYFGPQRFGRLASNLEQVELAARPGAPRPGRSERGRLYSAARAMLFNEVLSLRLVQGNWNAMLPGDVLVLDGSGRLFLPEDGESSRDASPPGRFRDRAQNDSTIRHPASSEPPSGHSASSEPPFCHSARSEAESQNLPGQPPKGDTAATRSPTASRLATLDIHLTGPLPGANFPQHRYATRGEAADMENAALEKHPAILDWLRREKVEAGRRPLRLAPRNLRWDWTREGLRLCFALARGAYATSLIRELCITDGSEYKTETES